MGAYAKSIVGGLVALAAVFLGREVELGTVVESLLTGAVTGALVWITKNRRTAERPTSER